MAELKEVYAVQDGDSHWYVIPAEMKSDFHYDLDNGEVDEYEHFIEKYSQYMTGGDLNLIQLYAEI